MAVKAKEVYDDFNPQLVRNLPLKDPYFMAELTRQHLFSGVLKEEVMMASTEAEATSRFLYKAVERSLNADNREPFDRLLLVMEKFGDLTLNKLADEIKQQLNPSDTQTKPEPKLEHKAYAEPKPKPVPQLHPNDSTRPKIEVIDSRQEPKVIDSRQEG